MALRKTRRPTQFVLVAAAVALCLGSGSVQLASARQQSDFSGIFALADSLSLEDGVVVALTLRLANTTDRSALDTNVTVLSSQDADSEADSPEAIEPAQVIGRFDPVDLHAHSSLVLTKSYLVSRDQFARWRGGDDLRVSVDALDGSGERRQVRVGLKLRGSVDEVLRTSF
jgi:hypothetical protein